MRIIARKCDLVATHEKSSARQDLVEQHLHDFRVYLIWTLLINKRDYDKNKVRFLKETFPKQFELLSKFLVDKEWLVGKLN
jgi:hypothetical protein